MDELWQRLRVWLEQNAPDILQTFNPPASSDEIDRLRVATQNQLPDLYEFLSLANGQDEAPLFDRWSLLSGRNIRPSAE